jgi:hypothetical protein
MGETAVSEVTAVAAATGSKDPEVALAAVAAAWSRCWRR